jgi:3-oxoacyl-[acyl-carrier protein] reductase
MCRQKDGVIINITSASVWNVDLAQLEYIASKAALDAATRKMAKEWGQYNVRVNAIAPGLTNTKMVDHMEESLKSMIVNSTSLKRLGEIDDVVNLCMFLIDEKSKYITGQTYRIDGGM